MARNLALQILRGIQANMPSLSDGEFYFCTDTGLLFVGLGGGCLRLEANMAINIADPVVPTQVASVEPAGVAGTYFLCVKNAQDTDRTKVILSSVKVTSITTEALLTLTIKKGDASVTTGTSYTVTQGKTLRIQSIKVYSELTTAATAHWVSCRIREGAAGGGAVSVTSDIVMIAENMAIAVTDIIGIGGTPSIVTLPDGMEIAGGQQIGISELALNADLAVTVVLIGFEY